MCARLLSHFHAYFLEKENIMNSVVRGLALFVLVAVAGCTRLSDEDRALLTDTRTMAQQARDSAAQAAQTAQQAQAEAARSAAAAQEALAAANRASDKADRIFREGQNK